MNDLLTRLIEAGTPARLVAEVAMELGRAQGERDALDRRRANDRDRQNAKRAKDKVECHVTSRDVTCVTNNAENAPLPPPPLLSPHTPQITPPPPTPVKITRARKGTRLDDDWAPSELKGQAAEMVKLWPPGAIEREVAKFRNYWAAKPGDGGIKIDWQKTWVNWLISADERIAKHVSGASTHTRRWIDPSKDIDAAARALGFD